MRLLVTGHAGFIGKHFVRAAKKAGHTIIGLDKKVNLDISNFSDLMSYLLEKEFDMIVHLAATCSTIRGIEQPDEAFRDNTIGTYNIVRIAQMDNVPVIYTSTCKAKPQVKTPYGMTKYMGEIMLKEWFHSFGVRYVINRPGTIYGPGQQGSPESGWLSWFIKCARSGRNLTIYGDGQQTRDVLYVEDYVALLLDQVKNFEKYMHQVYDVGGGWENALNLNKAVKLLKIKKVKYAQKRQGDVNVFVSENKEIGRVNGWRPKVGYKTGIKRTVTSYNK